MLYIAEISTCDYQPQSGSCWAWDCKQRSAVGTEPRHQFTEPVEAGNFVFYCSCWGKLVVPAHMVIADI